MPVYVHLPTPLRRLTQGQARVEVTAATVSELLAALEAAHPGMAEKLLDENGAVRRYVNLYVNDEDIRFLQGMATPLVDGDAIAIVPAIAGG
ncbi:MAG: ubiquitin-like small modifier protein 1 [Candidatus Latescibacterota bacterium]|jgi:molybdopterin synthase sulfur carrier subunit